MTKIKECTKIIQNKLVYLKINKKMFFHICVYISLVEGGGGRSPSRCVCRGVCRHGVGAGGGS